MPKTVRFLLPATSIDMDGFPVKQALPTQQVQQVDPFLLLHHARAKYNNLRPAKQQGVAPHPHRGFSPVTFIIEGEVHHRDSFGHNQIAKQGEVQWVNAGAGIIHSERPSQDLVDRKGRQEIVQLWINTPASKKMKPPSYQYFSSDQLPVFHSDDGNVANKLIAGKYAELTGKFKADSELLIVWSRANGTDGTQTYRIPDEWNAMIYVVKGQVSIKGYGLIGDHNLAVFTKEGEEIAVQTKSEDAEFILLAGLPLDEKVTQHGPFVMNNQTQILEAMRDYQMGKMGILIEDN